MLSRRQKRAIIGTLAFGLLAAVILFSIGRFFAHRSLERQLAEERASLVPPQPMVIEVVRDNVVRQRSFAGRAEPWTRATLSPEVGGTVVRLAAEVGERIQAGAELLILDDAVARATAEAAQIQAEESARRLREVEQLVRDEAVATTEAAAAGAAAAAAAREAQRATTLLNRHRLQAPFAGQVQARHVDVGDFLNPGQPAFDLVDVRRLRLIFHVGETEIASFAPGVRVEARFPALLGRSESCVVRHVAPAAGPGGLFRVEAEVANPDGTIPAGVSATITAAVQRYRDQLFVPTSAVRLEGSRAVALRLRGDGASEPVVVEIAPELDGRFPVLGGLNEGDRLLVR
jgi:RND family efflux transporter MFP subunit